MIALPKVSVIIPVYNVEKYLRQCIESVINQTLTDIEIICVNDGSTDNSLSILEEYASKDDRIVVISKENGGYASAINVGLEAANGEFIQIVESDDYCDINMLEEMYNKISGTDADMVTSDFYTCRDNRIHSIKISKYLKEEDKYIDSFNLKTLPYIINKAAYPWKSLYRKAFLEKNDIYMPEDGKGCYEDQPWNTAILVKANKILYVNKPFYYYRISAEGSSTNCGKRSIIDYIKRRRQALEILQDNNLYYDDIEEYFCAASLRGCTFFLKRIAFEYKEEYYNKMKEFLMSTIENKITCKYFTRTMKNQYCNIKKSDYKKFYAFPILKNKLKNVFSYKKEAV